MAPVEESRVVVDRFGLSRLFVEIEDHRVGARRSAPAAATERLASMKATWDALS